VAEEPEHVLVEHGIATLVGQEEVRTRGPVEQQHRQSGCDGRQRDDQEPRVGVDRPDEQRHAHPRHAGGSQHVHRRDEVDRAGQR
jgi:hypothetical protein